MTPDISNGEAPRATIAAIAEDVGVSVATVSKVLNGRGDVAADTRNRVEASLEAHSYQRRARRQAPAAGNIELVFHTLGADWGMEIIRGVQAVTKASKVSVVLSHLDGKYHPTDEWVADLIARRPLGVLFVESSLNEAQLSQLNRQRIPMVVVATDSSTTASVPTVGSNNWNGGLLAARHLIELGHTRIGVIGGPQEMLGSQARLAGFRLGLDEAGLRTEPDLLRHGNFYLETGYLHGMALLSRSDRPTAIFAGSDMQAMGVLRAARRVGLDVPRDLSLVGYDNLPLSAWIEPALTTVNQPLRDMSGTAARMLLDLTHGIKPAITRIDLVTELVVRESTAPPR